MDEYTDFNLNMEDVSITSFTDGVNSAQVRLTHHRSGSIVAENGSRSKNINRQVACMKLRDRVLVKLAVEQITGKNAIDLCFSAFYEEFYNKHAKGI